MMSSLATSLKILYKLGWSCSFTGDVTVFSSLLGSEESVVCSCISSSYFSIIISFTPFKKAMALALIISVSTALAG